MRKKYLSALLFGALLVASTGTFTSCKDYDDDINNLQEQIDAQKSLSEKLAAAETAITELQKADTELQAKIDAATDAAEKAALEAQQNAIAEAAKQLEAVKTELTALINGQTEATNEAIEDINAKIAEIQGAVQALEKLNGEIEALKNADATLNASITDLEAKVAENARLIGELQTALKTQEEALNNFKEATGTDIADINSDIKALQDKIAEIIGNDDMTSITEQLKDLEEEFDTLSTKVDGISTSLNTLKYAFYTGVTSVSLYPNFKGLIIDGTEVDADDVTINLLSAKSIADRTFGADELAGIKLFDKTIDNQYTVKKGERSKLRSTVVVRVSPVTATLTAESIKFVDCFGEERLKDLVSVKVRKYDSQNDEILTRAGQTSPSGLWVVELEATGNGEDFETKFDEATLVEKDGNDNLPGSNDDTTSGLRKVLFAMKVVDSQDGGSRGVVSEYDLAFGKSESEAENNIDFDVFVGSNRFDVTRLHNRAIQSEETAVKAPAELFWTDEPAAEVIKEGARINVSMVVDPFSEANIDNKKPTGEGQSDVKANDNRQGLQVSDPADPTKPLDAGRYVINPVVKSSANSFTIRVNNASVTHYYVVLDKERSVSSDNSEITAWNVYEQYIEGINTVKDVKVDGRELTINFNKSDINDVIGFRVFALNSNGTLVDPDGRAFYVRVGEDVANVAAASTSIIPDASNNITVESAKVAFDNLAQFADNKTVIKSSDVTCDKVYVNNQEVKEQIFDFKFVLEGAKEGEFVDLTYFKDKKVEDLTKIKSVYVTKLTDDAAWSNFTDDKTYKNEISFKNDKGVEIAKLEVNVTKTLPTSLPEGFGWKDTQLTGDTYNCYLFTGQWEAGKATQAMMYLDRVFNVDTDTSSKDKYTFTFKTNNPKNDKEVIGYNPGSQSKIELRKGNGEFDMIDGKTEYAAIIEYNYGAISSKTSQNIKVTNLTAAEPKEYKLIYHNLFAAEHYAIDWADADALKELIKVGTKNGESIEEQAQKVVFGNNFSEFITYNLKSDGSIDTSSERKLSLLGAVAAISGIDKTYNKYLSRNDDNYIKVTDVKFITKSNDKESEYFKPVLSNNNKTLVLEALQTSSSTSPITGPVPSILRVKLVDSFGFERIVELPMTVVQNL